MSSISRSVPEHFKGKDAMGHVAEVQAQGFLTSTEVHGTELPGYLSAAADTARDTAVAILLVWILLTQLSLSLSAVLLNLLIFAFGWVIWKTGRSAWLGWTRLERLHRILEQERWEIEHHRPQERDELRELYSAKGFEGKLLEDVLDVLMADDSRILRIMVEEEMGLSLGTQEHPLKQALGAFGGGVLSALVCLLGQWLLPVGGLIAATVSVLAIAAIVSANYVQNRWIPAMVWSVGLGSLAFGCSYFLLHFLRG